MRAIPKPAVSSLFFVLLSQLLAPALAPSCPLNLNHCIDADAPQPSFRLPVKIYKDFLVVLEGQIGGDQNQFGVNTNVNLPLQNFVIDTGTAPSIINESVVRKLGRAGGPVAIPKGVGGDDLRGLVAKIIEEKDEQIFISGQIYSGVKGKSLLPV